MSHSREKVIKVHRNLMDKITMTVSRNCLPMKIPRRILTVWSVWNIKRELFQTFFPNFAIS